jgi:hypothetical protein
MQLLTFDEIDLLTTDKVKIHEAKSKAFLSGIGKVIMQCDENKNTRKIKFTRIWSQFH